MEKNKNISLDELFARAKGEEPVISQEDVRTIVSSATSPVQSISKTTSIISRKGFIMSGLGLVGATAALVGYLAIGSGQLPGGSGQGGSGQWSVASGELGNGKIETTTPTNEPKKEVKVTKKMIIVSDNGDGTQLAIDPNVPEPPIPPIPPLLPDGKLMAPVEVEMVSIIQAKDEDLAKLGLEKTPNGDLLYKGAMKGGTVMTINIPAKGWGVVTNMEKSDEATSMTKLSPTIITDSRGNKRYMRIADENSLFQYQRFEGGHSKSVIIKGANPDIVHIEDTDDDADVHSNESQMIINMKGDGDTSKHSRVFSRRLKIKSSDSLGTDINEHIQQALKKVKESLQYTKRQMKNNKKINVDLQINDVESMLDTMKFDDASRFQMNIDSLIRVANANGKVKGKIIISDIDMGHDLPEINDSEMSQYASIPAIPGLERDLRKMEEKVSKKLNSLVPVLVRQSSTITHNKEENRDYDNGVIMWFEPEQFWKQYEEVASSYEVVMPRGMTLMDKNGKPVEPQSVKSSSATIISNTIVYPNPVRTTKTNIHYKLSEPRSVAFSVHDILGKKVVDCGSLAERPQGEYDFELNIGNIPAGIYLVVITTDKGEQTIQRIAVEK